MASIFQSPYPISSAGIGHFKTRIRTIFAICGTGTIGKKVWRHSFLLSYHNWPDFSRIICEAHITFQHLSNGVTRFKGLGLNSRDETLNLGPGFHSGLPRGSRLNLVRRESFTSKGEVGLYATLRGPGKRKLEDEPV